MSLPAMICLQQVAKSKVGHCYIYRGREAYEMGVVNWVACMSNGKKQHKRGRATPEKVFHNYSRL